MFAPLNKTHDELRLPRVLPRSESGKLNLVTSIGQIDSLPVSERVHRMLALANRFVGEHGAREATCPLFGMRLARQMISVLENACPNKKLRVAEVFPRESLAVEDFVKNAILPHVSKLPLRHVTAFAKPLAQISQSKGELFAAVSKHLGNSVGDLGLTSLVQVLQACSIFEERDPWLFRAIADGIVNRLNALTPELIVRTVRAVSLSGYRDDRFLSHMARKADGLKPFFSTNQLAEVAMGFGRLGISNAQIVAGLAKEVMGDARRSTLSGKAVVKLAWALAACDEDPSLVRDYMTQHAARFECMTPAYNNQRIQALLAIDAPVNPAYLVTDTGASSGTQTIHGRRFERGVIDLLVDQCGVSFEDITVSAVIAGIESDLLVVNGHRNVVIECDGDAYHRTWGPDGGTILGKDIVQDKARARLGYTIVHVRSSDLFGGSSARVIEELRQAVCSN